MRRIKYFLWCACWLASALQPGPVRAQEIIDGIMAVVDNEPILRSEVATRATLVAREWQINPETEPEKFQELLNEVYNLMIDEKVLLAKAREDSIEVAEAEVDAYLQRQIDQIIANVGSIEKVEEEFGFTMRDLRKMYREEQRNRLMIERLRQKKNQELKITSDEIRKFYETHKDSLPAIPERYSIRHIMMEVKPNEETDAKARVLSDSLYTVLKNGVSFDDLAIRFSQDPGSAPSGGRLMNIEKGTFVSEYEETVQLLRVGEIARPVRTKFGYHIIKLLGRDNERFSSQHILISVEITGEDEKDTIAMLTELKRVAAAGVPFDSLALLYSDDPNVRKDRGNLGWFEPDKSQVPQFAAAVKSVKPGEITPPFKTQFGFHIILVHDYEPAHSMNLDDDFQKVERMARERKGLAAFTDWVNELKETFSIDVKETF